ncbi:MAG: S41 family peptidase [Bacteroidia bacterium]|nr:S41 family peptidase [Bacteroidia bacterium]
MRYHFSTLFLVLILTVQWVRAQDPVRDLAVLDSIIAYSETHSVHRNEVNWTTLGQSMREIHAEQGLVEAVKLMLKELNDFHGRIWVDNVPYVGVVRPWKETSLQMDSLLLAQYRSSSVPFRAEVVGGNYGYLRIPGMLFGPEDSARAHQIFQAICKIHLRGRIRGWILDLRLDGGGTMFPMLTGLSPLLGNQKVGAFADPASNFEQPWLLRDREMYLGDYQVTRYGLGRLKAPHLEQAPVVVLISSGTSSSGEVVAIAFRNRPRTWFLGEETAGYTTTVSWLPMSDRVVLQLTESWYADRAGNLFTGTSISPDETIEGGNNFRDLSLDQSVLRAIEWLKKHGKGITRDKGNP